MTSRSRCRTCGCFCCCSWGVVRLSQVVLRFRFRRRFRFRFDPALQQALEGYPAANHTPALVSRLVCEIRRSKLPDPVALGNAGSFFWNPQVSTAQFSTLQAQYPRIPGYPDGDKVKIPAAWLIEQAGWKGYRDGDVGVHREHALVLVNYGAGSGAALVELSERIQASVLEKFDIQLWPEVRIV